MHPLMKYPYPTEEAFQQGYLSKVFLVQEDHLMVCHVCDIYVVYSLTRCEYVYLPVTMKTSSPMIMKYE